MTRVPLSTTLFLRFKQGDRQALGSLLDHLRPYIRVIVRSMNGRIIMGKIPMRASGTPNRA